MTVVWWTDDSAAGSELTYESGGESHTVEASNDFATSVGRWRHAAVATELVAGQSYTYQVRSLDLSSESLEFRTPKGRQDNVRIHFLGDGRTDDDQVIARHRDLMDEANTENADLVVELGDTVFASTNDHWFKYLRRILTASDPREDSPGAGSLVPSLHINGNHEIATLPDKENPGDADYYKDAPDAQARFSDLFVHPPNDHSNPLWRELYYVVDYGAATLIVLDANNTSNDDLDNHSYLADGDTPDWEPGSEQHAWLTAQLERAQEESVITIVMAHPSPYSSGEHGTDAHPGPDDAVIEDGQRGHELRALDPLFREYGVDAVITSHDHLAERNLVGPNGSATDADAEENINYFVLGNSGSSSRSSDDDWKRWMSVGGDGTEPTFRAWHYDWAGHDDQACYIQMDLTNNGAGEWTADFRFIRNDKQVFDELHLTRFDPQFQL
jgi:hypothetical protein